jgi:hypothetical protein
LRNIETVIEPKPEFGQESERGTAGDEDEGEAEQARRKYSFRIQLKSSAGESLR